MEIHFTSEEEDRLARIATKAAIDPEHLVKDAKLLAEEERFRAAVREGIAQADRSQLIDAKAMDARIALTLHRRLSSRG